MDSSLSAQLFATLFRVQGYSITGVRAITDTSANWQEHIVLEVEPCSALSCPVCGRAEGIKRHDYHRRYFYVGSLLCSAVYAETKLYRVRCPDCGIHTQKQSISDGKKHYSEAVSGMVLEYTRRMDNVSAASLLGLSSTTVYRIDREELSERLVTYEAQLPPVTQIAVDEVAHRKGHTYATIVTNQEDGRVIWAEEERTTESLTSIYQRFPNTFSGLRKATMDFWRPFEKATSTCFPQCQIVYDRFHLSGIVNRCVDNERRAYQKQLETSQRKTMKRHTRWLLLRRQKNCTQTHLERFEKLKQDNQWLYELYLLKEDFLSIFDENVPKEEGKSRILEWTSMIQETGYIYLKRFAKNLKDRLEKIIGWFDNSLSNAKAEGINNVIKTLLKRGYGYSSFQYFRLKILQRCGYLMNHVFHTK
jgi:transposase